MKRLILFFALIISINSNAQSDLKTYFAKSITEKSKISLYENDPTAWNPGDSMTVCKLNLYNRNLEPLYKTDADIRIIAKSLDKRNVAYTLDKYVFETEGLAPKCGAGTSRNNKNIIAPFAYFTYYVNKDNDTVLIVVQANENPLF